MARRAGLSNGPGIWVVAAWISARDFLMQRQAKTTSQTPDPRSSTIEGSIEIPRSGQNARRLGHFRKDVHFVVSQVSPELMITGKSSPLPVEPRQEYLKVCPVILWNGVCWETVLSFRGDHEPARSRRARYRGVKNRKTSCAPC